jgi:hypothetical protein
MSTYVWLTQIINKKPISDTAGVSAQAISFV